jgi:hypothetical protein
MGIWHREKWWIFGDLTRRGRLAFEKNGDFGITGMLGIEKNGGFLRILKVLCGKL